MESSIAFGWSEGPAPRADDGPDRPEIADVARLARRGLRGVLRAARAVDPVPAVRLLTDHLGPEAATAPVAEATWPAYEHVNVQAAFDAWLAEPGRTHRLVGLSLLHDSDLAAVLSGSAMGGLVQQGNVSLSSQPVGPDGQTRACVANGLYLVGEPGPDALALLLIGPDPRYGHEGVRVQAVGADPDSAEAALARLRDLALEHNVLRGQVLSFDPELFGRRGSGPVTFHRRTPVPREAVILPDGVLDALERHALGVARHRERLVAAGQHLKRGLLLFGPPGTGKTHTVRYLIGRSPGTTVVRLTGPALNMIGEACSIARALAPSMVVVEDVDLIAEDRDLSGPHSLLFQLLNEMDGLTDEADVVFVLTTNRVDVLERALAARPGRVDQAVELGLPDAAARRALLELYRGTLVVEDVDLERAAVATEGVTASFLREVMRRAALVAAETAEPTQPVDSLRVTGEHVDEALAELFDTRNAVTRRVLGAPTEGRD